MGNPLQDSCLENPVDRGAWRVRVYKVAKGSDLTEQLSTHACWRPCTSQDSPEKQPTAYLHTEVSHKVLAPAVVKTEVCQDLQLASWRPRMALGIAPVHDPRPENQEC